MPNAVMKTLTTTIMKTKAVETFSKMFSLKCLLGSFRSHFTAGGKIINITTFGSDKNNNNHMGAA